MNEPAVDTNCPCAHPNNCLGLMIFFCAFRSSDALFQPCHFLFCIHWGFIGVSLVFWHFGSCLRHTHADNLTEVAQASARLQVAFCHAHMSPLFSQTHLDPPTFISAYFAERPPSALFSSYPSNILCCIYTDEAEEDELFCTYGRDDSWCLLQFSAASPGRHSARSPHSCYVLFFRWCSCVWSPWLWGWRGDSFWFLSWSQKWRPWRSDHVSSAFKKIQGQ